MKRGYSVRQVRQSLESLCRSNLPFGASLMFGAPGETPETIAETLDVLKDYPIPQGVWVTVGVYLWTEYQDIVGELRQTGELQQDQDLFSGVVYISPHLERPYLEELILSLRSRRVSSSGTNQVKYTTNNVYEDKIDLYERTFYPCRRLCGLGDGSNKLTDVINHASARRYRRRGSREPTGKRAKDGSASTPPLRHGLIEGDPP
jgi:hypothetical protein